MTIEEANRWMIASLTELYDEREATSISSLVMEELTQMPKYQRVSHRKDPMTKAQENRYHQFHSQLMGHRPVQYVLGKAWFGSTAFCVNENVLIPRPETEELVDWLLQEYQFTGVEKTVLDIGTGSGCIPVTIKKKRPDFIVYALDISKEALEIAATNARLNETKITFNLCDIRDNLQWNIIPSVDIIISNPPYIPEKQKQVLEKHIRDFEPSVALFVPDADPIIFYKLIGNFALQKLTPGGRLFLEIHHDFAKAITDWYEKNGFLLELRKDFFGNNRMIKAWRA